MRILSFNVNGIRSVHGKGFLEWLGQDAPDILSIQETKAEPSQLTDELKNPSFNGTTYYSFWASAKKRGYSGTAIYTKQKPLNVSTLGISDFDDEGRVLIADYEKFSVISAYFPNSQDERRRLHYKLEFCEAMLEKCKSIVKAGRHFVLSGDYNIAHKPIDLAHPKENENNAGYYPEERAFLTKFLDAGFVDTFRHFEPDTKDAYSWWTYRGGARERNVGWRIDYHCVDSAFMPNVKGASILKDVHGSDHCPVEIVVEDLPA